ncbi:ATP-binding protein [Sedimentibacter sp.]|uniref:sensor histidine kinase n=1 Tax=Sedimentibacter sp. TaxID=1960295 RepID=UPI00289DAA99|nr:ATP-binding protein [Sedimentibacter sp.]
MIKRLLKSLLNILLYPFRLIMKIVIGLLKRLRFSIAFKISASYVLIYIIIILIVAVSTSAGCMVFEFQKFERNTVNQDVENIKKEFPYLKGEIPISSSARSFEIYNDDLNSVYPDNNDKRYSDNIIVVLERLLYSREYLYSTAFEFDNSYYYLNISYDAEIMIYDAFKIIVLVLASGALGLLIFVPVISSTSYRLTGPIKNMTEITKTITVNNINTRLDIKGTQDELKELSQTFNEMMDRIEQGYKFQQQFVSDASHELRTPIAVIKGYVNMLDRWGKNDKAVLEESIGAIKNETDNMQDLIEKLLFIARSDKGNLAYSKEDFKISTILNEIEKETKMIDTVHKLYFKFYDDANVYGDIKRVKQAIRIIIDNSIKYTPAGGYIMVSGFLQDDYYVIKIEDTGIGIDKKDLGKIFDRLYRAEQSRSKEIGGHGLGLSIAKIIVLGHKGKIRVKSTIGKGSEFSIMLPYIN